MANTIGWIGVGSMGHRMCRHLAAAGHALVVADAASSERAPPQARIATGNAEVAQLADTIILSLPDGSVSEAVARQLATAPGRKVATVIDTSTIGIKAAEVVDAILAEAGIHFIDAPVSGGTAGADKATLAIMVACPSESYERFQGLAVKLLNNYLSATALAATSEAIAFGTQLGIDMKVILDIDNASSGRNSATDDKFPRRIIAGKYDAGFT